MSDMKKTNSDMVESEDELRNNENHCSLVVELGSNGRILLPCGKFHHECQEVAGHHRLNVG